MLAAVVALEATAASAREPPAAASALPAPSATTELPATPSASQAAVCPTLSRAVAERVTAAVPLAERAGAALTVAVATAASVAFREAETDAGGVPRPRPPAAASARRCDRRRRRHHADSGDVDGGWNAKNAAGAAAQYTDDAVLDDGHGSFSRKAAIATTVRAGVTVATPRIELTPGAIEISGSLAVDSGTYTPEARHEDGIVRGSRKLPHGHAASRRALVDHPPHVDRRRSASEPPPPPQQQQQPPPRSSNNRPPPQQPRPLPSRR